MNDMLMKSNSYSINKAAQMKKIKNDTLLNAINRLEDLNPIHTIITNTTTDIDSDYYSQLTVPESEDYRLERLKFENSNPFKVGDEVLLVSVLDSIELREDRLNLWNSLQNSLLTPYLGKVGTVKRIATTSATGPCMRIVFNGVGINIWDPNMLRLADDISKALYGDK